MNQMTVVTLMKEPLIPSTNTTSWLYLVDSAHHEKYHLMLTASYISFLEATLLQYHQNSHKNTSIPCPSPLVSGS
jgi:hypothetical protein